MSPNVLSRLALLARTVRYLRPRQIAGQIGHRLLALRRLEGKVARLAPPAWPGWRSAERPALLAPGAQRNTAEALAAGRFVFLNDERALGWPPKWPAAEAPKLWQYNLHYFEWAWALDWDAFRGVWADWMQRHTLARGAVGWEPYPVSLRLMNVSGLLVGRFRDHIDADAAFRDECWRSLWRQGVWLEHRLEYHLLGNHLMENASALAFIGSVFAGPDADRWRAKGLAILRRELAEQMLADGMHYERSPMYHARALYVLECLAAVGAADVRAAVEPYRAPARRALAALCHPDGDVALFNDSALGIATPPALLLAGEPPPVGAFALEAAGYYGWRGEDGTYVICDAGNVGPDYLPGHAHADFLSFELSIKGHRVIVDAGVFDYVESEWRRYARGVRGHNTAQVDSADPCELWGSFRVARRGHIRNVVWEPRADGFALEAEHDGYARLPGSPIHRRRFEFTAGRLTITDTVTGADATRVVSRVRPHPDARFEVEGPASARVEFAGGAVSITAVGATLSRAEDHWYFPEFGVRSKIPVLDIRGSAEAKSLACSLSLAF